MKQILFIAFILFTFNCCSQSKGENEDELTMVIPDDEYNISLVRLIATPEKYDGKTIQIIGYLNLEFEGNAVYLHQEDYEKSLSKNSFWVDFSKEIKSKTDIMKYNKKYVIIVGRFNLKSKGHMGMFGGSIENISRLDIWK